MKGTNALPPQGTEGSPLLWAADRALLEKGHAGPVVVETSQTTPSWDLRPSCQPLLHAAHHLNAPEFIPQGHAGQL